METSARLTTALADRYRVVREIGVGGMASVHLAHDVRHDRDVAIKVLHPDLAAALGAERFLAEIKTTARLQHPHILPLLDSGEADGLLFYVMPFVAGESLRARLDRETQLPVDEAIRLAREVASAIESAHRHGVVHRDIKPENILLHEGQALVADFGIALAVSAAGGARMTQTGLSLGTPAYMAPEQAMGERMIDGRADVYALGAVLYEMLAGEAPFTGPSVQAIVARVMTEQPRALTGQRKSVPPHVDAAVARALEKLPADRFATAAEFAAALVAPMALPHSAASDDAEADDARPAAPSRRRRVPRVLRDSRVAWAVAAALALVAIALAARGTGERRPVRAAHLAIPLPSQLTLLSDGSQTVDLSPDGSTLAATVFADGAARIAIRRLDTDSVRLLPGVMEVNGSVAFSPDGQWIATVAGPNLVKTPVGGGPVTRLATARWGQSAWAPNGAIVYIAEYNTGLFRVSAEGGDSAVLTTPDRARGELGHWWPQVLPDGEHVLFTAFTTPADRSRLEVVSLRTGRREVALEGAWFGRYAAGQLLFVRAGAVHRVAFDAGARRPRGAPAPTGLDIATSATNGSAAFALDRAGTIAFVGSDVERVELVWVDRAGRESPAADSIARYSDVEPSPDGRRLAFVLEGDVWVHDPARRVTTRLTRTEHVEGRPRWSPDGRYVYYRRDMPQFDIYRRVADASAAEVRVITSPLDKNPGGFSPDGRLLFFETQTRGDDDIWELTVADSAPAPRFVLGGPGIQRDARVSPDGRWIAYSSNESGRFEVFVSPYPADRGPARHQVSTRGGGSPRWSADGASLVFGAAGRLYRAPIDRATGEPGAAIELPRVDRMRGWGLGPDGRVLVARQPDGGGLQVIRVVLDWIPTLRDERR